jgi:hypothetical protein
MSRARSIQSIHRCAGNFNGRFLADKVPYEHRIIDDEHPNSPPRQQTRVDL